MILSLKQFMQNHNLKDQTISESDLKKYIIIKYILVILKY